MVSEGANIAVQLQLDRKVSVLLVEIGCQELFYELGSHPGRQFNAGVYLKCGLRKRPWFSLLMASRLCF